MSDAPPSASSPQTPTQGAQAVEAVGQGPDQSSTLEAANPSGQAMPVRVSTGSDGASGAASSVQGDAAPGGTTTPAGAPAGSGGELGQGGSQGHPAAARQAPASVSAPSGIAAASSLQASSTGALAPPGAVVSSTAPAAVEAAPQLASGVAMQDMIESIRATIDLAVQQGSTQARIALQPAELGEIRIHLSQTADGLLARVSADTPAAAQALAQGRSELHQSLSSLGLPLLRLDVGGFGQSSSGEPEARTAGDSNGSDGSGSATRSPTAEDEAAPEALGTEEAVSLAAALTSGGLIDVLA